MSTKVFDKNTLHIESKITYSVTVFDPLLYFDSKMLYNSYGDPKPFCDSCFSSFSWCSQPKADLSLRSV